MYQTLVDFLNFIGIGIAAPETIGELITWFVGVMVSICIIRFVLNSFYSVVIWVRKGK